jgi:hypothetical protein
METLEVRAHHVEILKGFIYNSESLQDEGDTEGKRAALEERNFISTVYGERTLATFDDLRRVVIANPQIQVKVTLSPDAICGACRFQEGCGNGDYAEILEAYKRYGRPQNGQTPIEADAKAIQDFSFDTDRAYTAEEILL